MSAPNDNTAPAPEIPAPPVLPRVVTAFGRLCYNLGLNQRGLPLICGLILALWVVSGVYKVQPDERGVVLRFGQWVDTAEPGLHYHFPAPIEAVLLPKVTTVNQLQLDKTENLNVAQGSRTINRNQMLTGDENIIEADCAVFWRIKDAGHYLFKLSDPPAMLKVAAESALRQVIARNPIQAALSDRRQQIAEEMRLTLQQLLDDEQAGVEITQVQLQRADPPLAVIDAFNDVQRARADQERARNEAEAYSNDILPRARGEAEHIKQEAESYKTQVVDAALGDAKSFLAIYDTYKHSQSVTAWRLYSDSIDALLKRSSKVILDSSGKGMNGVVPYMPISEAPKPATPGGTP